MNTKKNTHERDKKKSKYVAVSKYPYPVYNIHFPRKKN